MYQVTGYKGYGSAGASTKKRSTKGFTAVSGSPREDIDDNNYSLIVNMDETVVYLEMPEKNN